MIEETQQLSIVIPWCNRQELRDCLQALGELCRTLTFEIIVVRQGGDNAACHQYIQDSAMSNLRLIDIGNTDFNKSRCLNIGVAMARSERIFLCDCDVLVHDELIDAALHALIPGCFVTVMRGVETKPSEHPEVLHALPCLQERVVTTELLFSQGRGAIFETRQTSDGRSLAGLLFLRRSDYVAVGGANSRLQGWGFEDYDLQIRLQVELGLRMVSLGAAIHVTHQVTNEASRYRSGVRNALRAFSQYNEENFLGTYNQDIAPLEGRGNTG